MCLPDSAVSLEDAEAPFHLEAWKRWKGIESSRALAFPFLSLHWWLRCSPATSPPKAEADRCTKSLMMRTAMNLHIPSGYAAIGDVLKPPLFVLPIVRCLWS